MSTAAPERSGVSRYQTRYVWLFLVATLAFSLLIGRLWSLQILDGEDYWRASTQNIIRDIEIEPARGRIYDAKGVILADNRASFDVVLTPRIFKKHDPDRGLEVLSRTLNLTRSEIDRVRKKLDRNVSEIVVRRDITRTQVALLEANRTETPGVEVRPQAHRIYPLNEVGAHAVGFLGEVSADELERLEGFGYRPGDYIGRMGLEREFEATLRGSPGVERQVVDARGQPRDEAATRFLIGEYQRVSPIPGRDLVTTLDAELMLIIDRAMASRAAGAVVAIDPRDGSVLALYSKPSFNPNSWTGRLSTQEKLRSDNDPYKPMLDKTVNAYFPGSVYKVVGSLAALEEGLMQMEEEVYCGGYYRFGGRRFRCWKRAGHGHTNVREALRSSCDVYYYRVAEQLGIDPLAQYAYRFGFGEPTGLGINNESAGRVPTKEWHRKHGPDGYQYGFALNTVIGQGDTLTSPLQVAMSYSAIANGGDLHYPRLLSEVRTRDGETLFTYPPRVRKRVEMSPEHLATIRSGLVDVVSHEDGTAHKVALDGISIAGKTGTAQVHKIGRTRIDNADKEFRFRDHAWFASYAPAESPEIVIVVFLQHGGHGGSDAAPVAMEIYENYFNRGNEGISLTEKVSELAGEGLEETPPEPVTDESIDPDTSLLPALSNPEVSP